LIRTVATNLTDLHKEPSFLSELLTQVTNGVALNVLKEEGKWCFVRQSDGYEGWAYAPFLVSTSAPQATHLVSAPQAHLYAQPAETKTLTRLLAGTAVRVAKEEDGWCRVELAGDRIGSGWICAGDLRPLARLPLDPPAARKQMIEDARQLRGVYYLWGGCSAWGIDCSGLAQLVHRLSGYAIPRDCVLQYPAGREIQPPFHAGDLLYFWNEARTRVGHVGVSLGEGWNIIHSSRGRNGVYEEDVQANQNLRESYAGARSFLPAR
jgi:cell wall-associated NlpC family hydrolase